MKFISIRKFKYYTKEIFKFLNISLLASGFIIAIVLIKYKPMYQVKISGEQIGYIENKEKLNEQIKENIENYTSKNIEKVELTENPEYELKLVEKTKESNESEIIIALQKRVEITYKYYELALNEKSVENVDTLESAEKVVNDIKQLSENTINLTVKEKTTTDIQELSTNTLEVAKENIIKQLHIDTAKTISKVNGIKIGAVPVSGYISSRYGVRSSIRVSTHTGLDIAAPNGTPIKAIAKGTVKFAGWNGSYGYLVKIDHGNGVESWYAHTSKMYVKVGEVVTSGDVIAAVGSTGNSTGAHLHLEIRINGSPVNPQKYLYN